MKKKRIIAYVDWLNIFHSILSRSEVQRRLRLLWLDLRKLIQSCRLRVSDVVLEIRHYSAFPGHMDEEDQLCYSAYIRALKAQGIKVIQSSFKQRTIWVRREPVRTFEEKGTDVGIAVDMIADLYRKRCDGMMVVSGDSDFEPAVVHALEGGMEVTLIAPPRQRVKAYRHLVSKHGNFRVRKISDDLLERSLLPDEIVAPDGEVIRIPEKYAGKKVR